MGCAFAQPPQNGTREAHVLVGGKRRERAEPFSRRPGKPACPAGGAGGGGPGAVPPGCKGKFVGESAPPDIMNAIASFVVQSSHTTRAVGTISTYPEVGFGVVGT